jgi:hypothetical protein
MVLSFGRHWSECGPVNRFDGRLTWCDGLGGRASISATNAFSTSQVLFRSSIEALDLDADVVKEDLSAKCGMSPSGLLDSRRPFLKSGHAFGQTV